MKIFSTLMILVMLTGMAGVTYGASGGITVPETDQLETSSIETPRTIAMTDSMAPDNPKGTTEEPLVTTSKEDEETSRPKVKYVGIISKEWYDSWSKVTVKYITPVVGLVGIATNGFGICVMHRCRMNEHFKKLLYAIIISDVIYLISELLSSLPDVVEKYDVSLASFLRYSMYSYLHGLTAITFAICNTLITIMSVERCMKVLFPLKMKIFLPMKYTYATIGIVYSVSIITRIHGFFVTYAKEYYDPKLNLTMYRLAATQWSIDNKASLSKYTLFLIIGLRLVPMMVTVGCNLTICVVLARQRRKQSQMASGCESSYHQVQQRRMTITLIILAIFMTLANVPSSTSYMVSKFMPETYGRGGTEFRFRALMSDIGKLLKVINAGNDFVVFLLTSAEMRRVVRETLTCTTSAKQSISLSSKQNIETLNQYKMSTEVKAIS